MSSRIVVLVAGKDPLVSIGGHGSYVRAHGRAAMRAGFESHVFSVAPRSEVLPTGFGMLHRTGSPLWPDRVWMVPVYASVVARTIERFVLQSALREVMIHSIGLGGGIGVTASRRLLRQGIQATAIVSVYGIYEDEVRQELSGLNPAHGLAQRIHHRVRHLWSRHLVDRYERRGYTRSRLVLVNYEAIRRLLQDNQVPPAKPVV